MANYGKQQRVLDGLASAHCAHSNLRFVIGCGAEGECPRCKVPLGFPTYYRVILFIASEGVLFGTIAFGYMKQGPGWLLIGWPFGLAAVFMVQGFILRAFPPKVEPHAEGNIWLKLT